MKEMEKGFSKIIVSNKEEMNKAEDLLKFMCIYPYAVIEERGK